MHKCNFCQRQDFPSRQSFYAHLKWCPKYLKHKQNEQSALGTSLREAIPKGHPHQATSASIPPYSLPQSNVPTDPLTRALQNAGLLPLNVADAQETSQQKRRRLLQTAKSQAVDHHRWFTSTVTAEMRAAAKLAIEHELSDEPLEEFPPQEVIELAEGVRDRVYASCRRRQEKETRRTQEAEIRKRADQRDDERKHTEHTKRKVAFLNEAQRRVIALCETRSISPSQRIQVLEDVLTQLDEGLTGAEPLSEAYAAIKALLQAQVADWDAYEAAREAKRNEEWWEIGTVVVVALALWLLYAKGPEILEWLVRIFTPEPAGDSKRTQHSTTEASQQTSDVEIPRPPIRRMRRPPQSPAPEPPPFSWANPFL